jgi:tetratricopeptide (TPR) repeat protein
MSSSSEVLQQAIRAARAGHKLEARDLLIELVEVDPRNEMAWIWLSGLVDTLEDRIIACENVLTINPANEKMRAHLAELQRQHQTFLARKNIDDAIALFNQAKAHALQNDLTTALQLARQAVEKREDYEEAWLLIGRISPDMDQQIVALEKASRLNPSNTETASALKQTRYLKANPMDAAARLEELGKFEEALKVYEVQAAIAKNLKDFDHIQKQIIRINRLREEKIRHVAPTSSIARLTFGWPLLYLSLALMQMGLNPLKHPNFYLWLGLPLVILGGFLLALAEVRSHHVIWQKFFREQGAGSSFARSVAASTGWFLVLIPHVWLVLDSWNRLRNFTIPSLPF